MNFLDLFAGGGGLSEGFIRAGYKPIAHIEMDRAACQTLKTRVAFQFLNQENRIELYLSFLQGHISRKELWNNIPQEMIQSVINAEISKNSIPNIISQID